MGLLVHRRVRVECRVIVEDTSGNTLLDLTTYAQAHDDGTVAGLKSKVATTAGQAYDQVETLVDTYGRFRNKHGDA